MTTTTPWTDEQLRNHAVWLHKTFGEEIESLTVGETVSDHVPGVDSWGPSDFQAYQEAMDKVLGAVPDLAVWAVALGADVLEPTEHRLEVHDGDQVIARLHFAFAPDLPAAKRDAFVTGLGHVVDNH